MRPFKLETKEDFLQAIKLATNGAKIVFSEEYYSMLKIKTVSKKNLFSYLYLRALLAIRAGKLVDAENSLNLLKTKDQKLKDQINFLISLTLYGQGKKKNQSNY